MSSDEILDLYKRILVQQTIGRSLEYATPKSAVTILLT